MSNKQRNKNVLNNTQRTAENAALRVLDNDMENPENSNSQRVNKSNFGTPTPSTNESEGSNTLVELIQMLIIAIMKIIIHHKLLMKHRYLLHHKLLMKHRYLLHHKLLMKHRYLLHHKLLIILVNHLK